MTASSLWQQGYDAGVGDLRRDYETRAATGKSLEDDEWTENPYLKGGNVVIEEAPSGDALDRALEMIRKAGPISLSQQWVNRLAEDIAKLIDAADAAEPSTDRIAALAAHLYNATRPKALAGVGWNYLSDRVREEYGLVARKILREYATDSELPQRLAKQDTQLSLLSGDLEAAQEKILALEAERDAAETQVRHWQRVADERLTEIRRVANSSLNAVKNASAVALLEELRQRLNTKENNR